MLARLSGLFLMVFAGLLAADEKAPVVHQNLAWSGYFLKTIISMLLILVLLGVAAWYVRRFGFGALAGKGNDQLKVVAMLSMGSRERLVIVQAGDEQILLGVVPGEIRKLQRLGKARSKGVDSFANALTRELDKEKS